MKIGQTIHTNIQGRKWTLTENGTANIDENFISDLLKNGYQYNKQADSYSKQTAFNKIETYYTNMEMYQSIVNPVKEDF